MHEISKEAGVGYSTLKLLLPKMLDNGLIEIKKQLGKFKLYGMNKYNPVVKKIYYIYITLNNSCFFNKLYVDKGNHKLEYIGPKSEVNLSRGITNE